MRAVADLWLIGADFLKEAINGLHALRNAAIANRQDQPFIFKYFNLINMEAEYADNGLSRFINPLVRAINQEKALPKMLLVVSDRDIVTLLYKADAASAMVIGATLHYIIKQLDMVISRYKQGLMDKKPGALLGTQYPKIIWVRMIKRPISGAVVFNNSIYQLRGKFNSILEDTLMDGEAENHYLISIDVSESKFDITGNRRSAGKAEFWSEISKGLEKFDNDKISLRLRSYQSQKKPSIPSTKFIKSVVTKSTSVTSARDDEPRCLLPVLPPVENNHFSHLNDTDYSHRRT